MASATLAERKPPRAASPTTSPVASPTPAGAGATPATGPTAGVTAIGNRQAGTAGPRVTLGAGPPGAEVSLKGASTFEPPQSVVDYLKTHPRGGGEVAVRFPGLAAGAIRVQEHRGKYSTPDELQAIDLQHPALEPLRSVGLAPLLAVRINNNAITGYVTVSTGRRPIASAGEIVSQIRRHADTLGMLGMGDLRTPTFENKLDGGALSLKTDLAFTLGGFLKGTGSLGLSDEVVTFTAHADASVRGVANLSLDLTRRPDGVIGGRAEIPVTLKNFSGNFVIALAGGIVDASGTFRYTTEKLSGEVTLLITDAQTARTVAYQHLPPEAIDASARDAAGGSAVAAAPTSAGPKPGPRAVAGWGTLDVHYNDWLSGRALVIVDSQGHVTVVGKITPPGKVEFPQTKLDYERKIFGFEVRAAYGIPVVGNVFLFAGVGLFALAKISPLTLSKIEIVGTYSTDPAIFNSFSLSANLNISALAGVRLRAEGGVGIEIAEHDIKIGAALTATAGIRAYVDATPLIGYRELADPTVGRRGEFYIHGEAEIAAQPFLALAGELFVKLVTPWWSPASDHTWTWPLGELMYPLPGEIGVGADVDYVFGSGKLPTISPKKVDFNADRFMSDLMDDNVPHGSAAEVSKPGRWGERLQAPPAPPAAPQIKDSKGPGKRKDDKPVKDAGKTWAAGMKALGQLKQRGEARPYAAAEIEAALKTIKSQHGFSVLQAKPVGDQWEIAATLGKDSLKKPLRIKRATGGGVPAAGSTGAGASASDTEPLQFGKERHQLHGYLDRGRVRITIASDENDFDATVAKLRHVYVDEWRRHEATRTRANQLSGDLDRVEKRVGEVIAAVLAAHPEQQRVRLHNGIFELRAMVAAVAAKYGLPGFTWISPAPPNPRVSVGSYGRTTRVEVKLCIYSYQSGSEATLAFDKLPGLLLRKTEGYQRGHLLARALGGKGDTAENLTPLDRVSNTEMRDYAEKCARENLDARHPEAPGFDPTNIIEYTVSCEPPRQGGEPEQFAAWLISEFPAGIPGRAGQPLQVAATHASRILFRKAQENLVARADFALGLGADMSEASYQRLRRGLAYYFLARVVRINMEVLQGKAKVGRTYPVDNHRSDPLP